MKTAARIVLVVFFVFTFCECQIEPDSVLQQILKCELMDSNDSVTVCTDLDNTEACLKNIVLVDGWNKDDLQRAMDRVNKTRKACIQECEGTLIAKCLKPVTKDKAVKPGKSYEVMYYCKTAIVDTAFDCLDKFEAKCPHQIEIIQRGRRYLSFICSKHPRSHLGKRTA